MQCKISSDTRIEIQGMERSQRLDNLSEKRDSKKRRTKLIGWNHDHHHLLPLTHKTNQVDKILNQERKANNKKRKEKHRPLEV